MTLLVDRCPSCEAAIVPCSNGVWLDYPAVAYDEARAPWTIMDLGSQQLASVGDPSPLGRGHSLHEHQPG